MDSSGAVGIGEGPGVGAGNVSRDFENSVSDFEVLIIKKR